MKLKRRYNKKMDCIYYTIRYSRVLHKEDGPAQIFPSGGRVWYRYGKKHRLDGPALEYCNGYKEWWINGLLHRVDGPAIIDYEGLEEWYINGTPFKTKEAWFEALTHDQQQKMLFSEYFVN
jgi:hypothetical protein